jgi:hypothetical protein
MQALSVDSLSKNTDNKVPQVSITKVSKRVCYASCCSRGNAYGRFSLSYSLIAHVVVGRACSTFISWYLFIFVTCAPILILSTGPLRGECYSSVCRKHNPSWWKHPKLRKLMLRAQISCALKVRQSWKPFASFVPRGLDDYLVHRGTNTQEEYPFGTTRQGAVLFADASGFTALTEQLATKVILMYCSAHTCNSECMSISHCQHMFSHSPFIFSCSYLVICSLFLMK